VPLDPLLPSLPSLPSTVLVIQATRMDDRAAAETIRRASCIEPEREQGLYLDRDSRKRARPHDARTNPPALVHGGAHPAREPTFAVCVGSHAASRLSVAPPEW
jgi:hypothetical protein